LLVLKPGGHLVAFAGSRTYDWIALGVRLAGFEVRDQLIWMYGSGFPKSRNIGGGRGTALKPAHEPIVLARKPLAGTVAANVLEHGTGAINVDGCRVGVGETVPGGGRSLRGGGYLYGSGEAPSGAPSGAPSHDRGRWPANILHDGSPEVLAVFPDTTSGANPTRRGGFGHHGANGQTECHAPRGEETGSAARFFYCAKASRAERELGLADFAPETVGDGRQTAIDNAYQRGKTERRNVHPTVKPVAAMRWLCRLATPSGGTILDPYTGSGTTGVAAALEGFDFIGCDLSPEYVEIARARIAHAREFPAMWEPDYQAPEEVPAEQLRLFSC